jgi:hypothetical protein
MISQFKGLIQFNWMLAVEVVLASFVAKVEDPYLDAINRMDVSVSLIEVVHTLSLRFDLPSAFLSNFITHSIDGCFQKTDPDSRVRIVGYCCELC